nr:aminotransferase class I/II-fold pyridoxal phosphate-dependent enzyme [uncultured Sphaerochaeta sp.]
MHYDFDTVVDRTTSLSVKWNRDVIKSVCGNPDAEPFWVADMDFPVAGEVAHAARDLAQHAIFGYPHAENQRQVFCNWAKMRHQLTLAEQEVVISQGVLNSIAVLVEQLTRTGEGIIVPLPAYQPFLRIVRNLERELLSWPLLYDEESHRFSLDWAKLEALADKAKMLIFCSPHNPSGLVFDHETLTRLCKVAKEHDLTIICDEIHADLNFTDHVCLDTVAKEVGATAITCMAPSKTFNIAGEHYSATLFTDAGMRSGFVHRLSQLFITETSTFATTLAIASYEHGLPWLQQLLGYLQKNASMVEAFLAERVPQLVFIKPGASFIGFVDCSKIMDLVEKDRAAHPELYDEKASPGGGLLSRFFGQRAGLAFNDGTWFGGDAYRNFVRMNYGTPTSNVQRALYKMEEAVNFLTATYTS